ncbi:MAG TPA: sigma-70 family RNA polymerase sigma factor [Pirellulales bacterium]|nr:sigma-70 family RNA polymerase sigma factor [Pirellulales bacterium]
MTEDAELARRAAAGEHDAVGRIYDRYAPLLRAILLDATGAPAEADELVQEVFVRALGNLRQLREPAALAGWLVSIARREGTDFRRRQARNRTRFVALDQDPLQPASDGAADTRLLVHAALAELPDDERLALHIHYLCGEPVAVARQALELSSSGFYKLLERARERLRTKLLDREAKS